MPTLQNPPLRILILGLNYAPELTGIGKYTGEMAAWLSTQGHQVRVVTAPPYYPAWRIGEGYRGRGYLTEDGGPLGDGADEPLVFRCPLYVPANASGLKRVLHLFSFAASATPVMLREVFAKPDIVITIEPTFFCAPLALAVAALAGAPAWLYVQDLEVDAAFDLGLLPSGGLIQRIALGLEGVFTRAFHRVSSISMRMVEGCLSKGVDPGRAVLFPNWVDVDCIQPQSDERSNAYRQDLGLQGKVVFLYSGNMGNKQGLELLAPLARAFQNDAAVHFIFCGDGTYRPQLDAEATGATNVTLLPLQPLDRLNDLLNAADVHLLPQRANTADLVMPSRLTGMLASGRPVLACAEPDTQVAAVLSGDADAHAACGRVVAVGNLAALVSGAQELLRDDELRKRLGTAAREYAVQHLGREQVLGRFEVDLLAAVKEFRYPGQARS
ncbi:MAG: WcaI family glycosyltransferase [Janthinobacterium lividum]